MPTLESIQQAFYSDLQRVPYHRRLGISVEPQGGRDRPRLTLPEGPTLAGPGGEVSPAALFALGDVAAATELAHDVAPRVVEVEQAVIFLTGASRFRQLGPARGPIHASSRLLRGLDAEAGRSKRGRRAAVEVAVLLSEAGGDPVAEYESSFQVRFMDPSRVRSLIDWPSELVDLLAP